MKGASYHRKLAFNQNDIFHSEEDPHSSKKEEDKQSDFSQYDDDA